MLPADPRVAFASAVRGVADSYLAFALGGALVPVGLLTGQPRAALTGTLVAVAQAMVMVESRAFPENWEHESLLNRVLVGNGGRTFWVRRESVLVARKDCREYATRYAWGAGHGDAAAQFRLLASDFDSYELRVEAGYVWVIARCNQAVRAGSRLRFGFETKIEETQPVAEPFVSITPSAHGRVREGACTLELGWDDTVDMYGMTHRSYRTSGDRANPGVAPRQIGKHFRVVPFDEFQLVSCTVPSRSNAHHVLIGRTAQLAVSNAPVRT